MNKRRVKRVAMITGLVSLLLAGGFGLSLRSHQRQEHLNRQLIAALLKQDPKQALVLVNAGADPNTPFIAPSPPSLTQLWNHLVHRTPLPRNGCRCAFRMACGGDYVNDEGLSGLSTDEPYLVETMLQHGAQKNAKEDGGYTPLFWSIMAEHPKTVDVLLKHEVDVNAQDHNGYNALYWVVFASQAANPTERSKAANLVRQLIALGADPNLPQNGMTLLQQAQDYNPDLVAVLKKAGAKK
jgi:hypothetical protein